MNEQNLRVSSPSEARENGKKGGIASGAARRKRKAVRQAVLEFLYFTSPVSGLTEMEEMILGMMSRVKENGDPKAWDTLMEYAGMSPDGKRKEAELKLKREELEMKKAQIVHDSEKDADIEDLSALAELLNEPDTED